MLIGQLLRFGGAEVTTASDGMSALEITAHEEFDLILMDIQMPGLDGCETTRELRSRGFMRPIVAVTASALPHERARGLGAGCDDYLTKPVDRDLFFETLKRLLSEKPRPQPKPEAVVQMRH